MSRYSDSDDGAAREAQGGSYIDRFRVDAVVQPRSSFSPSSAPTASARVVGMVERACRPTLMEPDLALNLEISDLINQKKGNL
jgi:hypothetical protein